MRERGIQKGPVSAGASGQDLVFDPEASGLVPAPVPGEGFARNMRWLRGWMRAIARAHGVGHRRFPRLAQALRLGTIALTFVGLAFGALTPKGVRITPVSVQLLVVFAIWIFASVGFWMLCWPLEETGVLGWMFSIAATVGAVIYVAATYANLAIEGRHLGGGVIVGFIADILFLPSIALLLTPFLVFIPVGDRKQGRRAHMFVIGLGLLAAGLLLFGMLGEPHLFTHQNPLTHQNVPAPLATTWIARWWRWSAGLGLLVLAGSVILGMASLVRRRVPRKDRSVIKWYAYGGVVAIVALIPYLLIAFAPARYFPSMEKFARAWGAVVVALVAVAAIPATKGAPWQSRRMKRLVQGAFIGALASAAHEFMVIQAIDHVHKDPRAETQLGGEVILTYAAPLVVAVAFEPIAHGFDWTLDKLADWIGDRFNRFRLIPKDLLEEAREDIRTSKRRLNGAVDRADHWRKRLSERGHEWDEWVSASPEKAEALREDIESIVRDIRVEARDANDLIVRIEQDLADLQAVGKRAAEARETGTP